MREKIRSSNARGSAMVEAAITINVFVALLIIATDISRLGYNAVSLQYLLSRSARWGIVGRTEANPLSPSTQLSRADSIKQKLIDYAGQLGYGITASDIHVCLSSSPNCTTDDAGGPNDFIVVRAEKPVKVFFGAFIYTVSATVFAKNEPYV